MAKKQHVSKKARAKAVRERQVRGAIVSIAALGFNQPDSWWRLPRSRGPLVKPTMSLADGIRRTLGD